MHLGPARRSRRGRGARPWLVEGLAALAVLCAACLAAGADEWRGWRGLEREGRSESAGGPLHWSAGRNVAWKTPIPGKGHSSPVVAGDRVVVTTAYATARGKALQDGIAYGLLALAALLPVAAAPFVVRGCRAGATRPRGPFLALLAFCLLAGVVVHAVFASHVRLGEGDWDAAVRAERRQFTGQVVVLCVMLGTVLCSFGRPGRLGIGVAATAFGVFMAFARPVAVLPFVVGVALVCEAGFRRRAPEAAPTEAGASTRVAVGRLVLAVGAFAVGLLAFGVPLASAVKLHFLGKLAAASAAEPYRWAVLTVGSHALVVCGLGLVVWLVVRLFGLWRGAIRAPRWLGAAILALGAANFVARNYVVVRREFVRAVVCVNRRTGAVRWVREGLRGRRRPASRLNSPATPTPVIDGARVVAWFGSPGLLCTDLDGHVLWTNRELPYGGLHGVGASPVPCDGRLVIVSGQPKGPYITALDTSTGERAWTTTLRPWKDPRGQHRTPTVTTLDGRKVIAYWGWEGHQSRGFLWVLDAQSGRELWRHPVPTRGEAVASVVSDGDTLYLPGRESVWALSLSKLSRGENPVVWQTKMKGKGPNAASPVLCGGLLLTVSDQKHLSCLDATTGALVWQERLRGKGTMASLVAIGSRVYVFDKSGLTTVVAAERTFRKLAESRLPEAIVASPAPVDGRLFIRTANHLWCIQEAD